MIITKNNLIREINYASMAVWCSEHWQSWFSFCYWDLKHTMQKILIFLLFLKGVKPKIKRTEIGFHRYVINGDLSRIFRNPKFQSLRYSHFGIFPRDRSLGFEVSKCIVHFVKLSISCWIKLRIFFEPFKSL